MKLFEDQEVVDHILADIEKVSGILFSKGWSEKNAGNISVRLPGWILPTNNEKEETEFDNKFPGLSNVCFYFTATGARMHDISDSAINNGLFVQVNGEGSAYYIFNPKNIYKNPTSEFETHMGIHNLIAQRGSSETAVLHTHATELIILTHNSEINTSDDINKIIWSMHPETIMFIPKGLGLVPFSLPGSKEIAKSTIMEFSFHDIVVWEKHGVFAIGKDIVDAFDNIDIACKSANIWLKCRSAGYDPIGFTEKQLKELKDLGRKFRY